MTLAISIIGTILVISLLIVGLYFAIQKELFSFKWMWRDKKGKDGKKTKKK